MIAHDVTILATARRAVDIANGSKDEFLAMLRDELRNPLSPIATAPQPTATSAGHGLGSDSPSVCGQWSWIDSIISD